MGEKTEKGDEMDIDEVFSFHPATSDTSPIHETMREGCRALAHTFDFHLPDSREKSLALTKLQEAMMFANAAIAIHS